MTTEDSSVLQPNSSHSNLKVVEDTVYCAVVSEAFLTRLEGVFGPRKMWVSRNLKDETGSSATPLTLARSHKPLLSLLRTVGQKVQDLAAKLSVNILLNAELKLTNSICAYVLLVQVCWYRVQCHGDCILFTPVGTVGKLMWVLCGWKGVSQVCQDQPLMMIGVSATGL